MEFDDCVHRIYVIGSQEQEELSSRFRQLSFEAGENGITGLIPLEEGGIPDGVPFSLILSTLQTGMEEASSDKNRELMESLYTDLLAEGVEGYRFKGNL